MKPLAGWLAGCAWLCRRRWICAASRSLSAYVAQEMGAYRLYTVVPYLIKFIDNLTNIYVR